MGDAIRLRGRSFGFSVLEDAMVMDVRLLLGLSIVGG